MRADGEFRVGLVRSDRLHGEEHKHPHALEI